MLVKALGVDVFADVVAGEEVDEAAAAAVDDVEAGSADGGVEVGREREGLGRLVGCQLGGVGFSLGGLRWG